MSNVDFHGEPRSAGWRSGEHLRRGIPGEVVPARYQRTRLAPREGLPEAFLTRCPPRSVKHLVRAFLLDEVSENSSDPREGPARGVAPEVSNTSSWPPPSTRYQRTRLENSSGRTRLATLPGGNRGPPPVLRTWVVPPLHSLPFGRPLVWPQPVEIVTEKQHLSSHVEPGRKDAQRVKPCRVAPP